MINNTNNEKKKLELAISMYYSYGLIETKL